MCSKWLWLQFKALFPSFAKIIYQTIFPQKQTYEFDLRGSLLQKNLLSI